jgi:hypothetical protein
MPYKEGGRNWGKVILHMFWDLLYSRGSKCLNNKFTEDKQVGNVRVVILTHTYTMPTSEIDSMWQSSFATNDNNTGNVPHTDSLWHVFWPTFSFRFEIFLPGSNQKDRSRLNVSCFVQIKSSCDLFLEVASHKLATMTRIQFGSPVLNSIYVMLCVENPNIDSHLPELPCMVFTWLPKPVFVQTMVLTSHIITRWLPVRQICIFQILRGANDGKYEKKNLSVWISTTRKTLQHFLWMICTVKSSINQYRQTMRRSRSTHLRSLGMDLQVSLSRRGAQKKNTKAAICRYATAQHRHVNLGSVDKWINKHVAVPEGGDERHES